MRGIVKGGLNDGGSNIKSIQRISYTWSSGVTVDIPISTVNPNNTIVKLSFYSGSTAAQYGAIAVTLSDANTVRLIRVGSSTLSFTIFITVTEYVSVKSKQTGYYTPTAGSTEELVTISPVNPSKSIIEYSVKDSHTSGNAAFYFQAGVNLKDATTLGITEQSISTVYWQLLEFY